MSLDNAFVLIERHPKSTAKASPPAGKLNELAGMVCSTIWLQGSNFQNLAGLDGEKRFSAGCHEG